MVTLLLAVSSSHRSPFRDGRAAGEPPRPQPVQLRAPEPKVESVEPRLRRRGAAAVGYATYYARTFEGRLTASGVRFDSDALVAAHPTYPFGTLLRVTNLRNGASTRVRIIDRGPGRGPRRNGVIIDLSRAAAASLGMVRAGRTRVRLEVVPSE